MNGRIRKMLCLLGCLVLTGLASAMTASGDTDYFRYTFGTGGQCVYTLGQFETEGVFGGDVAFPDFKAESERPWVNNSTAMGVQTINFTSSVTRIGALTCAGMKNLVSVSMYPSVTYLSKTAFKNCTKLKTIIFRGTVAEWQKVASASGIILSRDLPGITISFPDGTKMPYNLTDGSFTFTLNSNSEVYTGTSIRPGLTLRRGSTVLLAGRDFSVSYGSNKSVGTGTVTVTGKGDYTGSLTKSFKITKRTVSVTLTADQTKLYAGQTIQIRSNANQSFYRLSVDMTSIARASGSNAVTGVKTGVAQVKAVPVNASNCEVKSNILKITVVPGVTDSLTATIKSGKIQLKWKRVSGASGYNIYRNNKKIKTIKKASNVSFTDSKANKNGHRYQYEVIAYNNTYGSLSGRKATVYALTRPAITKLTAAKGKKVTVKWKKNAKCSGYEIDLSANNFKKTLTVVVPSRSKTGYTYNTSKYAKGKKLKVRVRSFIVKNGVYYYSEWSKAKTVKNK